MNSCGLALFFGFVFFVLALAGLFRERARRRALERAIADLTRELRHRDNLKGMRLGWR